MKKNVLAAIILFFALNLTSSNGQSLTLFDLDSDSYPLLKAKFYLFDENEKQVKSLINSDFTITENGSPAEIVSIRCADSDYAQSVSSVLTIDNSGSMEGMGLVIAKTAVKAWIENMPADRFECAVTTFNETNNILHDFSMSKTALLENLDNIKTGGGTDYNIGLLEPFAGSLIIAEAAKYKRVIMLLTDGRSIGDEKKIITKAKELNATIYCVVLFNEAPDILKNISIETGGMYFSNVNTINDAEQIFLRVQKMSIGSAPCEIEWRSASCGPTVETDINAPSVNASSKIKYLLPTELLTHIEFSPSSSLQFREVEPGLKKSAPITLTARNGDVRINGIVSDNEAFTIKDNKAWPLTLEDGKSLTLNIEFQPEDMSYSYAKFSISSGACFGNDFYAAGGYPETVNKYSLKLERPDKEDTFIAGGDTAITWSGVLPSDSLALSFSSDGGKSWAVLNNSATGLLEKWNIPIKASDSCLMRIEGKPSPDDTIPSWKWAREISAGNYNYRRQIAADSAGNIYLTGSFIGEADFGGGIKVKSFATDYNYRDIFLAKFDPAGKALWARAYKGINSYGVINSIIVDKENNLTAIGRFSGEIDFGAGASVKENAGSGAQDIFIVKFDKFGAALWSRSCGGSYDETPGYIQADKYGAYYISGEYLETCRFGPTDSVYGQNCFLAKYGRDGQFLWAKNIGGSDAMYSGHILNFIIDGDDIFITGSYNSDRGNFDFNSASISNAYGGKDAFLACLDADGNGKWFFGAGNSEDNSANCIASGQTGEIYIAGEFTDTMNIGSVKLSSKGGKDIYLAGFSKTGDLIEAKSIGGPNNEFAKALLIDSEKRLILGGDYEDSLDFNGRLIRSGSGNQNAFIAILPSAGINSGIMPVNGDDESQFSSLTSMTADFNGNIYITGEFKRQALFGNRASLENAYKTNIFTAAFKKSNDAQSDISDSLWRIVCPELAVVGAELNISLIGKTADIIIRNNPVNIDSLPVRIDSIIVRGKNSAEIQALTGSLPFTLGAGEGIDIEYLFTPLTAGKKEAVIEVYTQCGMVSFEIDGEGVAPSAEIITKDIDFGMVELNKFSNAVKPVIKNISSDTLKIEKIEIVGPDFQQFRILSGVSEAPLAPNEVLYAETGFFPVHYGRATTNLAIYHNGYDSPAIIKLLGRGAGIPSEITVPELTVYAGWKCKIPVMAKMLYDTSFAGVPFTVEIMTDRDAFVPDNKYENIEYDKDKVRILAKGTAKKLNTESAVIAEIEGRVLLSHNLIPTVDICDFYWGDESIAASLKSGALKVEACAHALGRIQLFGQTKFDVSPNPITGSANINVTAEEKGELILEIFNSTGVSLGSVKLLGNETDRIIERDMSGYSAGLYYFVLKTQAGAITRLIIKAE